MKHSWVQVKEAGGFRGISGSTRGVWLDFFKLHFTFQLLSVPLDPIRGGHREGGGVWVVVVVVVEVGVTGRVGACSWADNPGNFRLYVSALSRKGGVWSLGLWMVGGFGDLAGSQPQQEAHWFHTDKKSTPPPSVPFFHFMCSSNIHTPLIATAPPRLPHASCSEFSLPWIFFSHHADGPLALPDGSLFPPPPPPRSCFTQRWRRL
ncbi:hypothetical protein F7725_012334 [Dissostichus mawsoni]|uniref:Uncharacterized protein n=1 Tax=Dissostichus mawsoni TaxID=36200 RepID=A0A7J5YM15_DISMA|nr:hypothetical protein F7725_012334 [Dissostichus mawsoni]